MKSFCLKKIPKTVKTFTAEDSFSLCFFYLYEKVDKLVLRDRFPSFQAF